MKDLHKEVLSLKESLIYQEERFRDTLILNPVENIPFEGVLAPCNSFLHGLYNTDTLRNKEGRVNSKIQFSGRDEITENVNQIYQMWSELLGAEKMSMRLLSGLHAHTVLFMGLTRIGDKVMILPEKAGGHVSGNAILSRLGLQLEEIPYNTETRHIDRERCLKKIEEFRPKVLFVDRSEGIVFEEFEWLGHCCDCYKIFDASQYLTNIICGDYKNPFDMGFNLILSTMHKNLPGPQRAFVCTNHEDDNWRMIRSGISAYVSNMHIFSIYSAGLLLDHIDELKKLSKSMLKNAVSLDQELIANEVPVIERYYLENELPTHHCWIKPPTQEHAFHLFLTLERIGIMTNYRLLPYNIGYGLRLGLSGACVSGLTSNDIPDLAKLISKAYHNGYSDKLKEDTIHFIRRIKQI